MNRKPGHKVTEDDIRRYEEDGVVCLRGMFDAEWIALLTRGIDRNRAEPGHRSRIYDRTDDDRTFFYDSDSWRRIGEYERFVRESPCAEVAATLMGSNKVNLYFDAVFVRSPGQPFRTPWHQDEPYWSVDGFQTVSIWMPLVPVEKRSALELIPGSHVWAQKYRQLDFAELNQIGRAHV